MKPAPFEYRSPATVEEALSLLTEHGDDAQVLAGGQSLLPMMALRLARPAMLVDVGRIAELGALSANGGLHVGAGVSQRRVERSATAAEWCPLLHQAVPFIAHPPIRTRGTIGGSLAHADPAAELPAVAAALDAEVVLRGAGGERIVPADAFFLGYLTTARRSDELLVEVRFPELPAGSATAFLEISRRHGDFALVACAVVVGIDDDGRVSDARVALAGVDTVPVRARGAEAALVGQPAGPDAWKHAGAETSADLRPGSDIHATGEYRRHVAGVLVGRALAAAAARPGTAAERKSP
jgi:carbon-monoxide dehydrogenase medium subunit